MISKKASLQKIPILQFLYHHKIPQLIKLKHTKLFPFILFRLYYKSNFDIQKMSLVRNSSRKKFSISPEDLASCLDQKNSMIAVLQAEVEDLRFNQERYDRMQEEVYRAKEKYQGSIRDYEITKVTNQQRLELSAKNCSQLKIQVDHLDKQVQIKSQQLKDARAQSQQLVQHNSRRQDDAAEILIKGDQLRQANQFLKMEQDRTKSQILLAREQLERQRKQNINITKSMQNVKDKCYKTQSYIRSLAREQAQLNENLTKIQDENNYLDGHISELNTVQALATGNVSSMEKEIQQNKFEIASRQLELKRTQKQIKQGTKNLALEKDRMKVLTEQTQQRKCLLNRMEGEIRECSEQMNYIMAKNNEVTDVNTQLRNDLKVCERHLENVMRLNKGIDTQLGKFRQLNVTAIKKLQQPMRDVSNSQASKLAVTGKWSHTSRMTATGGFQCTN